MKKLGKKGAIIVNIIGALLVIGAVIAACCFSWEAVVLIICAELIEKLTTMIAGDMTVHIDVTTKESEKEESKEEPKDTNKIVNMTKEEKIQALLNLKETIKPSTDNIEVVHLENKIDEKKPVKVIKKAPKKKKKAEPVNS